MKVTFKKITEDRGDLYNVLKIHRNKITANSVWPVILSNAMRMRIMKIYAGKHISLCLTTVMLSK